MQRSGERYGFTDVVRPKKRAVDAYAEAGVPHPAEATDATSREQRPWAMFNRTQQLR